MAANVISLAFTVVFARVLGEDGYGSLIALVAAFLVLAIPGQAVQVAVAREVSREVEGHDPALLANVRGWARALLHRRVRAGAWLRPGPGAASRPARRIDRVGRRSDPSHGRRCGSCSASCAACSSASGATWRWRPA